MSRFAGRERLVGEGLIFLLVLLLALRFATLHVSLNLIHPPTSLDLLCRGEAEIPYQHRVLIPWLVERIHASGLLARAWPERMQLAQALEVLFVVSTWYALRALIARFLGAGLASAAWAFSLFYLLPFHFLLSRNWPYWYAWDVPSILFFAAGMLLIQRRAWGLYYPLFVLATLNRETSSFLILIFALVSFGQLPGRALVAHLLAQSALWWAITAAIRARFAGNPGVGAFYELALQDNLAMIREPDNWLLLASAFGFLWIPLALLWRRIEVPFARRALLALPFYLAASFYGAIFDELRIFGEMIPPVVLGAACLGRSLLTGSAQEAPGPQSGSPVRTQAAQSRGV